MDDRFKPPAGATNDEYDEVIVLSKKAFELWRATCYNETDRGALGGLLIEGDLAVACNGHLLICKPLPAIPGEGPQSLDKPVCLIFDLNKDPETDIAWRPKMPPANAWDNHDPWKWLVKIGINRRLKRFQILDDDFERGGRARGRLHDLDTSPYPDYEQVIPTRNPEGVVGFNAGYIGLIATALYDSGTARLDLRLEFETAHRQPELLGSETSRGDTVKLDDEEVFVRGSGSKGDPFVLDLYMIPEEVRYIHFLPEGQAIDKLSPCRIEACNKDDEGGFAVLMPVRL